MTPDYIDRDACTNFVSETEEVQHHDFGLPDRKGRPIGARLTLSIRRYATTTLGLGHYNVKPGLYYALHTTSTRAGEPFGPAFNWSIYTTREEREAAIAKYLKGALARARREAARCR